MPLLKLPQQKSPTVSYRESLRNEMQKMLDEVDQGTSKVNLELGCDPTADKSKLRVRFIKNPSENLLNPTSMAQVP